MNPSNEDIDRGISAYKNAKFELAENDQKILVQQNEWKMLMDNYNVAKEMVSMSTNPNDKEYWSSVMVKWAKEISAMSVPSNVVSSSMSQPRSTPSAVVTIRTTASSGRSAARAVSSQAPGDQVVRLEGGKASLGIG